MRSFLKNFLVIIAILISFPIASNAFWITLSESEIDNCKRKARKELNEFSAKQMFEDCKKDTKKLKKVFQEKQKENEKIARWCKANKKFYRTNLVELNKLEKVRRSSTVYKEIWEFIDNKFGLIPLKNTEAYSKYVETGNKWQAKHSRRIYDYPADAFVDFPSLQKELIFRRKNIDPFEKCNYKMSVYGESALSWEEFKSLSDSQKRKILKYQPLKIIE